MQVLCVLANTAASADPSLFIKHSSSSNLWVVYVDNMLVAANQQE